MSVDFPDASLLQRFSRRVGEWPPASRVIAAHAHKLDVRVYRWSRGRWTFTSVLSGLPLIHLTSIGARTGRPHTVPLIAVPHQEGLAVIASNHGQQHHPAWYHNLLAHPEAEIAVVGGATRRVRARSTRDDERTQLWQAGLRIYPSWAVYDARSSDREIPILVLEFV